MEILKLQGLSKYYTTRSSVVMGLTNVSLAFSTGEFVAITGESGSGKSTLAHVLGGILPYEAGELYVCGRPTSHYNAADWEAYRRDTVSFISQNYGILTGNTVLENVISALRLAGIEKNEAETRAEAILREVELDAFKTRRAGKLSSGQKQRLSIARALAKPSRILIADEPTGNLDRENSEKVIRLLKKASEDRLVILITHEFEEAKDAVTRRIVLSDGEVITDAALAPVSANAAINMKEKEAAKAPARPRGKQRDKESRRLTPYITGLTVRARPILSAILCAFLILTTLMTFVFLGNFIMSLDDTNTRVYDPEAFKNGAADRIVVMKDGRTPFTESDYEAILDVRYAESIEAWGYISDINYYYRPETDYHEYQDIVNGPNYHPVLNPYDYQVTNEVKFYEGEPIFLRTVPLSDQNFLTAGRLPESFYEVVSADPAYQTGDTVKVYIRNTTDWSIASYFCAVFDVVGETETGNGLYFSNDLGAAMSTGVRSAGKLGADGYIFAPFDPDRYTLEAEAIALQDNGFYFPAGAPNTQMEVGTPLAIQQGEDRHVLTCAGFFDTAYRRLLLVTYPTFKTLTNMSPSNQISLEIKDYAYADRVMEDLKDLGYVTVSPFRLGATDVDPDLASERLVTLSICLAALVLTVILQLILLRAMLSSLYEHFRLLSNIGLTRLTAELSVSLLYLIFTLVGEILGFVVILAINGAGISQVTGIFKYFDTAGILALFATHFVSVIPAWLITKRALRKAVFAAEKQEDDLDFSLMEDSVI